MIILIYEISKDPHLGKHLHRNSSKKINSFKYIYMTTLCSRRSNAFNITLMVQVESTAYCCLSSVRTNKMDQMLTLIHINSRRSPKQIKQALKFQSNIPPLQQWGWLFSRLPPNLLLKDEVSCDQDQVPQWESCAYKKWQE